MMNWKRRDAIVPNSEATYRHLSAETEEKS
jgi:hypothetical protein